MTDRHAGYIITLERDIREDDAEDTIRLLRSIKGIASVKPVTSDLDFQMAVERVRFELKQQIYSAVTAVFDRNTSP